LGLFDSIDDAADVVSRHRTILHGAFANHGDFRNARAAIKGGA
jgi:hypothetical protein